MPGKLEREVACGHEQKEPNYGDFGPYHRMVADLEQLLRVAHATRNSNGGGKQIAALPVVLRISAR